MKRFIRYGLISLFVLLLPLGSMMVHTTVQAQSYSQLINYVGIVRALHSVWSSWSWSSSPMMD